jgi:hypothetical protein
VRRIALAVGILALEAVLCVAPLFSAVAVVEEEVVFTLKATSAAAVFLVGDFNGWNPTMDLMAPAGDGFEIRLYLLPGNYRYRYIVDGVSKADPDCPCLDEGSNSCFTLVEKDGALEIVFAEEGRARETVTNISLAPSVKLRGYGNESGAFLFSEGRVKGTIDGNVDADLSVACSNELREDEAFKGTSFFLRGAASYRSERGVFTAFTRVADAVGLGDPLELFGSVGPYRYPVGLFCRGMKLDAKLPFGVESRVLYASRISGYRSGLEGVASPLDLFSKRDLVDSDILGAKLGAKFGRFTATYLIRQDRRPKEGLWRHPDLGDGMYRGFERAGFQGFGLSISGDGQVVLDGELLFGGNSLEATEQLVEDAQSYRDVVLKGDWENGQRLCIGLSRIGQRTRSKLSIAQTTLEGDRELRGGRPDGSRVSIDAAFSFAAPPFSLALEGGIEQYSASNPGSIFWLSRTNFWLDGDELSYDLIPFLSSREVHRMLLACAWKYEPFAGLPWGKGLRFSATERGDPSDGSRTFREAVLSSGVAIHPRVTLLLDMRGVSYRHDSIARDFVDVFLAAHGSITKSLWCACGVGVNPYAFDRWLYEFSDHGRADYLTGQGVFSDLADHGESAAMETLIGAEKDLSEDWIITFHAGFTF